MDGEYVTGHIFNQRQCVMLLYDERGSVGSHGPVIELSIITHSLLRYTAYLCASISSVPHYLAFTRHPVPCTPRAGFMILPMHTYKQASSAKRDY